MATSRLGGLGPKWSFPDSQIVALITGQHTEGKLAVFEQSMAPNGGVPLHINHREDESFYVMEGRSTSLSVHRTRQDAHHLPAGGNRVGFR